MVAAEEELPQRNSNQATSSKTQSDLLNSRNPNGKEAERKADIYEATSRIFANLENPCKWT